MDTTVIKLPGDLQRKVRELARRTGRAEPDLLVEAIATYVAAHEIPQPSSDGSIDDPHLDARDIDDWLAANWRPE